MAARPIQSAASNLSAVLVLAAAVAGASLGCGNRKTVEPPPPGDTSDPREAPAPPPPAEVLALYQAAATLDPLLLTQLASQEGVSALLSEAAREPAHRRVVIAALPYTRRLAAAEYLAQVATTSEGERELAFHALLALSAAANRNEDPEDLVELRRGCDLLAKLVAEGKGKKEDRARAVSALRAFEQHGCTPPPTQDYDAP